MSLHEQVRWVPTSSLRAIQSLTTDCTIRSVDETPVLPLADLRAWLEHAKSQSVGNRPAIELLAELDALEKEAKR